jgi:hypothetical protein
LLAIKPTRAWHCLLRPNRPPRASRGHQHAEVRHADAVSVDALSPCSGEHREKSGPKAGPRQVQDFRSVNVRPLIAALTPERIARGRGTKRTTAPHTRTAHAIMNGIPPPPGRGGMPEPNPCSPRTGIAPARIPWFRAPPPGRRRESPGGDFRSPLVGTESWAGGTGSAPAILAAGQPRDCSLPISPDHRFPGCRGRSHSDLSNPIPDESGASSRLPPAPPVHSLCAPGSRPWVA